MQQKSTRGVQQHEVDAAADALLAERARPTVERVRAKIGRGSPNTVGPMLEAWFASLAPRLGVALASDGESASIPPAVRQAMDQLWRTALDGARVEMDVALTQERETLAAQHQELQQAREEHARQRAAATQHEAALRDALALAKNQVDEQAQRIAQLLANSQHTAQDLAASRASLAGLVQERDADRRRFDEQLALQADARARTEERHAASEKRLLEEVDRARQDAKVARAALQAAQELHQQSQHGLQQRIETLSSQCNQAQVELASLRERLASAEREAVLRLQQAQKIPAASAKGKPESDTRGPTTPRRKAGAGRVRQSKIRP